MATRRRTQHRNRRRRAPRPTPSPKPYSLRQRFLTAMTAIPRVLLHPRTPGERPWKYLLPVLALAFAARAAIALTGDFVLHPDEIMQYLEPAHRLVFGNGVVYWEFFYGARSWLVPGLVAGVLALCEAVGLGEPFWYVGAVKLMFCAISLLVPAGMYCFARAHFGELTARIALLAGAFWYELVGFAHKPMTEFVATGLLVAMLALCVRPSPERPRTLWSMATLAVLVAAIRMHYAPPALLLLGLFFLRTEKKLALTLVAAALLAAVGVFDAITWGGGLFHSYVINIGFNVIASGLRAGESPPWQFLWWLLLSGAGLSLLTMALAVRELRRYGLLLVLILVVLLTHSAQAHREYRFIFTVIPFWLLLAADFMAGLVMRARRPKSPPSAPLVATGQRSFARAPAAAAPVLLAAVSAAGILNALPYQHQVYRGYSRETGIVRFIRNQDPVFPAYGYLAQTPGVAGVWHPDRPYFNLPGYFYLHRAIPFYDATTEPLIFADQQVGQVEAIAGAVTHVVSADPSVAIPGYELERNFDGIRILRPHGGHSAGPPLAGIRPHHHPRRLDHEPRRPGRTPAPAQRRNPLHRRSSNRRPVEPVCAVSDVSRTSASAIFSAVYQARPPRHTGNGRRYLPFVALGRLIRRQSPPHRGR